MDKLRAPVPARLDSPGTPPGSGTGFSAPMTADRLPKILNRSTDVEIPNNAWCAWIPSAGERQLRRPLTAEERSALERRAAELAPAVAPWRPSEADFVELALSDMFGGFTSMRQTGEDLDGRLDSTKRVLAPFPAWAIVKACAGIQANGVWRDGKFDRRWPPNDAEIVDAARKEARIYADQHRSAVALLAAAVEESAR